jgi:NADH-quinone oxidoreductase subunit J
MSNAGMGLFVVFSLIAVLSALGTIMMHSPIRAAMSLLAHIMSLSGLFLLLHAHLVAALQILVYAGAVVVLFVFVIMMIGPSAPEPPVTRGMLVKTASVAVMVLLTSLLAFTLMPVTRPMVSLITCSTADGSCVDFGGVLAFSHELFGYELAPFELVSVLLTVAVIGAIAVARGRTAAETATLSKKLQAREDTRVAQEARERALAAEVSAHGGH